MTIQKISVPERTVVQHIAHLSAQTLQLDFSTDSASFERVDNDLSIAFEDGGVLVVDGFFVTNGEELPSLILMDGTPVDGAEFLASRNPDMDLETAAGPTSIPSSGLSEYASGAGDLIDGVGRLGGLGTEGGVNPLTQGAVRFASAEGMTAPGTTAGLGDNAEFGDDAGLGGNEGDNGGADGGDNGGGGDGGDNSANSDNFEYTSRAVVHTQKTNIAGYKNEVFSLPLVDANGSPVDGATVNWKELDGVGKYFTDPVIEDGELRFSLTEEGYAALLNGNLYHYLEISVGGETYVMQFVINKGKSYNSEDADAFDDGSGMHLAEGGLNFGEWHEGNGQLGKDNNITTSGGGDTVNFNNGLIVVGSAGSIINNAETVSISKTQTQRAVGIEVDSTASEAGNSRLDVDGKLTVTATSSKGFAAGIWVDGKVDGISSNLDVVAGKGIDVIAKSHTSSSGIEASGGGKVSLTAVEGDITIHASSAGSTARGLETVQQSGIELEAKNGSINITAEGVPLSNAVVLAGILNVRNVSLKASENISLTAKTVNADSDKASVYAGIANAGNAYIEAGGKIDITAVGSKNADVFGVKTTGEHTEIHGKDLVINASGGKNGYGIGAIMQNIASENIISADTLSITAEGSDLAAAMFVTGTPNRIGTYENGNTIDVGESISLSATSEFGKAYGMYAKANATGKNSATNTITGEESTTGIEVRIEVSAGQGKAYAMFAEYGAVNQIIGSKESDFIYIKGDIGSVGGGKNIINLQDDAADMLVLDGEANDLTLKVDEHDTLVLRAATVEEFNERYGGLLYDLFEDEDFVIHDIKIYIDDFPNGLPITSVMDLYEYSQGELAELDWLFGTLMEKGYFSEDEDAPFDFLSFISKEEYTAILADGKGAERSASEAARLDDETGEADGLYGAAPSMFEELVNMDEPALRFMASMNEGTLAEGQFVSNVQVPFVALENSPSLANFFTDTSFATQELDLGQSLKQPLGQDSERGLEADAGHESSQSLENMVLNESSASHAPLLDMAVESGFANNSMGEELAFYLETTMV